jgi:hypothetical protein
MTPDAGIHTASMTEGDHDRATVRVTFIMIFSVEIETYLTLSICSTGRRSGLGFLLD